MWYNNKKVEKKNMQVNKNPILSGVSIAENGRIISSALPYDKVSNRGICYHNWIGAFFARIFGSGTLTVSINNKEVYLNKGSCSGFLKANKVQFDPSNEEDLIAKVQNTFKKVADQKPKREAKAPQSKLNQGNLSKAQGEVFKQAREDQKNSDFSIPKGVNPIDYTQEKMKESREILIAQDKLNQENERLKRQKELNELRKKNDEEIAKIDERISGLSADDPLLKSKTESLNLMKKSFRNQETLKIRFAKSAGIDIS